MVINDVPLMQTIPGTGRGMITGNVFYDVSQNGVWDPSDYGVHDGITLYLDLNHNGLFDSTEPSTSPDNDGNYQFAQLLPKVYTVGLQIGAGYTATSPVSKRAVVAALPYASANGIDFGLQAKNFGIDLNSDHQADLLLTDPETNHVYVQLRNGLDRLSTYPLGQLPSADWSVAGVSDLSGNGTVDVLLHNRLTGQLQAWELFPGPGVPVFARTYSLNHTVPLGFSIAGVGDIDENGSLELLIVRQKTGEHRIVQLVGDITSQTPLAVNSSMELVGVGDLDGDGDTDLLFRDRSHSTLLAQLYENGQTGDLKQIGNINANWSVAGVIDLVNGDNAEIVMQDRLTGNAYAWELAADMTTQESYELDLGTHDGLRLHLSDLPSSSISDVGIDGFTGAEAVSYVENATAAILVSVGTLTNISFHDFVGDSLTVWFSAQATVDDRLSITSSGDTEGKIGVDNIARSVRYSGVQIATFTGGIGKTPLVITFNSAASQAAVQATLKAISFSNVSENPIATRRTVSMHLTDGHGGSSNMVTRNIDVIPTNDPPVATTSHTSVTYTEGRSPVIIDNRIVLSDVDSQDFAGGKFTVSVAAGGDSSDRFGIRASGVIRLNTRTGEVLYRGKVIGVYTGTTTLDITFNRNTSLEMIKQVARRITFRNVSDAPATTLRQIRFVFTGSDGGMSPSALGDTVKVKSINDAPVLTLSSVSPARYIENGPAAAVFSDATAADADLLNFNLGKLTVAITARSTRSDILSITHVGMGPNEVSIQGNSIFFTNSALTTYKVASFTGGIGNTPLVITFTENAFQPEVQAVARAITFANQSDNPSTSPRTIKLTLTDGDGGTSKKVARDVNVISINDPPVITNFGPTVQYRLGNAPTLIAAQAMIADVDSSNFSGGNLSVVLSGDQHPLDRLEICEGNGIRVKRNFVTYQGRTIGQVTGSSTLTTRAATPKAIQALLRQITFRTTSDSTPARTVTATLTDGDGGTSVVACAVQMM